MNAHCRYYSDIRYIPSILISLKVLIPHFRVVLKSTPCTEHTIIVPSKEELIWESSHLHSVTVSVSIGVFLISPWREPYVAIVDCCNHAQHALLTMLTAMLTASGYWSTLAIFTLRHTTVLAARINWGKIVYSTVCWKTLPAARFTNLQFSRFCIKLYIWWAFHCKIWQFIWNNFGIKILQRPWLHFIAVLHVRSAEQTRASLDLSEQTYSLLAVVNTQRHSFTCSTLH